VCLCVQMRWAVALAWLVVALGAPGGEEEGGPSLQWNSNEALSGGGGGGDSPAPAAFGGGGGGGVRGAGGTLDPQAQGSDVPTQTGLLVEVPPVVLRSRVVVVPVGVELPGGSTRAVWEEWVRGVAALDLDPHPNHR
jgi:hypothetical protein